MHTHSGFGVRCGCAWWTRLTGRAARYATVLTCLTRLALRATRAVLKLAFLTRFTLLVVPLALKHAFWTRSAHTPLFRGSNMPGFACSARFGVGTVRSLSTRIALCLPFFVGAGAWQAIPASRLPFLVRKLASNTFLALFLFFFVLEPALLARSALLLVFSVCMGARGASQAFHRAIVAGEFAFWTQLTL